MSKNDDSNKFNLRAFNQEFEDDVTKNKIIQQKKDAETLNKLNNTVYKKPILDNNLFEILIGIKNTWFYLIDDLLNQKFNKNTFTKDNRLFYIGLTLFIFGLIIFLYNYLSEDESKQENKVIEKYYIYQQQSNMPNNTDYSSNPTNQIIPITSNPSNPTNQIIPITSNPSNPSNPTNQIIPITSNPSNPTNQIIPIASNPSNPVELNIE